MKDAVIQPYTDVVVTMIHGGYQRFREKYSLLLHTRIIGLARMSV
jgi:hypothetical protein